MNDSNPPEASPEAPPEASPYAKYDGDTIYPSQDATLRAEIERIKGMLEAATGDDEASTIDKTLFEVIRECVSRDSPLKSFLDNYSRTFTRSSLVTNGHAPHTIRTPQGVWDVVDKTETQRDYVLVLRDIDSDWCEALCTRYPGAIDRRFLLEHILGIDLQLSYFPLYQVSYDSRRMLEEGMDEPMDPFTILGQAAADLQLIDVSHTMQKLSTTEGESSKLALDPTLRASDTDFEALSAYSTWKANLEFWEDWAESDKPFVMAQQMRTSVHDKLLAMAAQVGHLARKAHGVHINWWRAPQYGGRGYILSPDTHDEFRRTRYGWAKSNAFVSCCRLASNLYLVLTSTAPSMQVDLMTMGSNRMMCMAPNFGSRVIVCMPDHDRENFIDDAVLNLVQQHWPVFDWKCPAETKLSAWELSRADGLVFASLLKETVLRMGVEREEGEMRDLAYLADTEDGAEHFKRLTGFRRVLARLHKSLGDAQSAFKTSSKAELHARGLVLLRGAKAPKPSATSTPGKAAEDSAKPQQPADFTRMHLESLQGLQERLDAIKEDLNEEIQIAIGSVQVHDAQTMKKQTTWTVVLTVLAAIYLPMTLVTGIFGMNITEISSEATAPDAWWAFGAWAVVFAVTLLGILLYAVVRKWKAKNKRKWKADLEANSMHGVHLRFKKRPGDGPGEELKWWARTLWQKTMKTWTSKRE